MSHHTESAGGMDDFTDWIGDQLGAAAAPALEGAISDPAVLAQIEATAIAVLNSEATRQAARRYFIEASIILAGGLFAALAAYRLILK